MRPAGTSAGAVCLAMGLVLVLAGAITRDAGHTASAAEAEPSKVEITSFPEKLDKTCRSGRAKLFDECGDQLIMFEAALARAAEERKVLLASYGAEWCIWCHVFAQYIHGGKTRFTYTYGSPDDPDVRDTATLYEKEKKDVTADALALKRYVSEAFVVVHIDGQFAPNGDAVLERSGADRHYAGEIPYIFSVGADGRFAARLEPRRVETRRDGWWDWYRGYSRASLKAHLAELHNAALAAAGN